MFQAILVFCTGVILVFLFVYCNCYWVGSIIYFHCFSAYHKPFMLHMAGEVSFTEVINLVPGSALQMQRELQWFKVPNKIWLNMKDLSYRECYSDHIWFSFELIKSIMCVGNWVICRSSHWNWRSISTKIKRFVYI